MLLSKKIKIKELIIIITYIIFYSFQFASRKTLPQIFARNKFYETLVISWFCFDLILISIVDYEHVNVDLEEVLSF